ncbi:gamma-glutamyltranspeptidase/glutathione hydrolase [Bradyrhizobium sp. USDA 4532]|uniref:gamma-glutamyltransferase n=1 Tax=unclassified Bradyrhizobium TaxID=2631580 RepID=UPI0035C67847|nr:gamma-glutamyltranspeptidase/glutathione hydrolase [Bradyrhizobium sp. USDA 4545]MCP1916607.1 gamma-glutamyltranspeptidase/glutathione hydrolase [Bradyrhizobium sp. USDA 4532]
MANLGMSRRELLVGSMLTAVAAAAPRPLRALDNTGALARSKTGMVTSPSELATQAGLEVLRKGGNAIEAVIAIGATLCVTYPHFSGLGGDSFMVISDRKGNVRTLSGAGQAALNLPNYSGSVPIRGPGSALTAATTVDVWDQAFDFSRKSWAGKQSWASLFARPIEYASKGFPVTPSQRFWQDMEAKNLKDWPDIQRIFMPAGRMPEIGEPLVQPELAKSLEMLAANGGRDFYEGKLAARIAAGLKQIGSPLTADDLARCRARDETPLRVGYRGGELLGLRPPTQGLTTLEIMGILDRFELAKYPEGSADYYHLLVEAVKQAFIDRSRYIGDPEFVDVPVNQLLSASYLDARAKAINLEKAMPWPHVFKKGDTVYLAATDRDGNCVSMLQTVYYDWGSGMVAGDTGIIWHNRGASFNLDPASPNCLKPGKRPFHTLNPGIYLKSGRPHLLYGTQGADGQPQTLAAVLTRLIDYNMDPLTALSRPRFLLGKTFSDARDSLKLEKDAGEEVFKALAGRGHEISPIPAQSPLAGHPGAIRIDADGSITGAHDPRSDGRALGLS